MTSHSPPILSATDSLMGHQWIVSPYSESAVSALMRRQSLPRAAAQLIETRAITDDIALLIAPSLKEHTPHPDTITDMIPSAKRLADAITNEESIGIISDYDVDGVSSAAQLAIFLRQIKAPHEVRIPDRTKDGYGPNRRMLDELSSNGAKLIISLDGGTLSHALWREWREVTEQDVIVIDHHHVSPESLPVYGFINPHRADDNSGLTMLCASGLTFLFLIAVRQQLRLAGFYRHRSESDLLPLLDLACLGTFCDMVPISHFNRVLTKVGLRHIAKRRTKGLAALMDIAGVKSDALTSESVTFALGPRLNAAGRMSHADIAFQLLTADNDMRALALAEQLNDLNTRRQYQERTDSAKALASLDESMIENDENFILIHGAFHEGVVGLLAGRLAERHQTLAIALYQKKDDDTLSGSLRSKNGIHIGNLLAKSVAEGHILKGGGHKAAGGLTLSQSQLPQFKSFLQKELNDHQPPPSSHFIDFDLPLSALKNCLSDLAILMPWGMNHPPPLVLCRHVIPKNVRFIRDGHLRCFLQDDRQSSSEVIAFRAFGTPLGDFMQKQEGCTLHILLRMTEGKNFFHIVDATTPALLNS